MSNERSHIEADMNIYASLEGNRRDSLSPYIPNLQYDIIREPKGYAAAMKNLFTYICGNICKLINFAIELTIAFLQHPLTWKTFKEFLGILFDTYIFVTLCMTTLIIHFIVNVDEYCNVNGKEGSITDISEKEDLKKDE